MSTTEEIYKKKVEELKTTPLYHKLLFLTHDLLNLSNDSEAEARLNEGVTSTFCISEVYFDEPEIKKILEFPTESGGTFEQTMQALMNEKIKAAQTGQSKDFGICSSHDIAPVLQHVFCIPRDFHKSKLFKQESKKFQKSWRKAHKT